MSGLGDLDQIRSLGSRSGTGLSGSGKSSVVRAGVVPLLKRQQTASWHIHVITPTSHPLEALATSLTHTAGSLTATTTLIDDLSHDQRCLYLFSRQRMREARLLIVVDQFEELFTLCRNEAERQAFVDNLLYAQSADGSATTIVIVLRADFYEHLAQYATLREAVANPIPLDGAILDSLMRMQEAEKLDESFPQPFEHIDHLLTRADIGAAEKILLLMAKARRARGKPLRPPGGFQSVGELSP